MAGDLIRKRNRVHRRRRGATLPLVALALVGMCSFVALGVDVGRVAVAKVQCQNAADVAAMAGARSLNGFMPQDLSTATSNAVAAAQKYQVLSQPIASSDITITHGTYHYDRSAQRFTTEFSLQPGEKYNLTRATVGSQCPTTFARVFGVNAFSVSASATAAHRPRDVCIVLDYSGSMNNESDLWNNESYLDNGQAAPNNPNNTSNNAETVYPLFGHYSNQKNYTDYAHYANLLCPSADSSSTMAGDPRIGKCNVSQSVLGIPAMVNDFWQNSRGATAGSAFTSAPDSYATTPGGDNYLRLNNTAGQPYASTVNAISGGNSSKNASFNTQGYKFYTGVTFKGYTQGPRYWGKTFFIWPPDPTNDWRQKYFGTKDNTKLWDAGGNWKDPSGTTYTINYAGILAWIKSAPNIFPNQLRSGNTLFYDQIPTTVASAPGDQTQRFWKEYIDYVVGVWKDPNGNVQHPQAPSCSYGPDYTFGTIKISVPPTNGQYMDYADNPERPRHRLWFGPMTMIQFMSDTGLLPGTSHDIAMYPMKIGVGGALMDIQNNHPNDMVSMILFSRPQYNNDAADTGAFNLAQYSLTNDYQSIINSLWIPPNSGSADVRPWDSNGQQTPRAHGDYDANTAASYGFMMAYNQLSGSPSLASIDQSYPGTGGLGRNGAQRLVIYETDGMANQDSIATAGFYNGGANSSYYHIEPGQTVNGAGYSQTNLLRVVQNLCNLADGTPGTPAGFTPFSPNDGYPGYAAPGKPVPIQCIAFGAIFESPSSIQTSSVNLLTKISGIGGTVFPASSDDPDNGYKWCIGTIEERQTKLRQAFLNIMNEGIPVTLIK